MIHDDKKCVLFRNFGWPKMSQLYTATYVHPLQTNEDEVVCK